MELKLRLSTADLENLLVKDGEVKIEIAQQIVEEFSRKHIKALVNAEMSRNAEDLIETELKKYTKRDCWGAVTGLKDDLKKLLDEEIKQYFHNASFNVYNETIPQITKTVEEQIYKNFSEEKIQKYVSEELRKLTNKAIRAKAQKLLKEALENAS